MDLDDFDYHLPREMIAQQPSEVRSASRLMVLNGRGIIHESFENLPDHLSEGDLLVLNDSRVVHARLSGVKETGGRVELLLLETAGREARCLIRGRRIRPGTRLQIGDAACEVAGREGMFFTVAFDRDVKRVMAEYGQVPLPHYIRERLEDPERYQTVYARKEGSVAAPTAGLHFTEELLRRLRERGVGIAYVTLHIGPSTFLPVREARPETMLPEPFSIGRESAEAINEAADGGRLIPVGTSTVKALESAAGDDGRVKAGEGESRLFIAPGYRFRLPYRGMVTNFHLPRSTLLMLVSALFGRERILQAYSEAIARGYRFYSFGDAMLVMRQ